MCDTTSCCKVVAVIGVQKRKMAGSHIPRKKSVKVFKERTSLFIHLFDTNEYIRGLYNVCVVQMALFFAFIVVRDSFSAGRLYVDLSMEVALFGGPYHWAVFAGLETLQLLGCIAVHPLFIMWQKSYSMIGRASHVPFVLLYGGYVVSSWFAVSHAIQWLNLPPVFKVISSIESMRITMKSYSFIRENAYKVLYPWNKDDEEGPAVWYAGQMQPRVASFSQYFYFIFAPTLIYRDHYPRNKGPINWNNVVVYGFQFLTVVYISTILFGELHFPSSFHLRDLVDCYLICFLLSPLMNILAGVLVLHTWGNFTAELTRFADREFYSDWWNSESYATYYRKWNVPIHDWLLAYTVQDLKPFLKNRAIVAFPAFLISSLVHDYHIGIAMGFFTPLFLILFAGIGGLMFLFRPSSSRLANILTFAGLSIGVAIIESFYCTELAARVYCPLDEQSYFRLRAPHCYAVYNGN